MKGGKKQIWLSINICLIIISKFQGLLTQKMDMKFIDISNLITRDPYRYEKSHERFKNL